MNEMPNTRRLRVNPGSMYLRKGAVDRAVGAVVGSAVGDALGAHYETTYPGFEEEIAMRPGGGFDRRRALGGWTDDTSMVLGVLDSLAAGYAEAVAARAEAEAEHRGPGHGAPARLCEYWDPPPGRPTSPRWPAGTPPGTPGRPATAP